MARQAAEPRASSHLRLLRLPRPKEGRGRTSSWPSNPSVLWMTCGRLLVSIVHFDQNGARFRRPVQLDRLAKGGITFCRSSHAVRGQFAGALPHLAMSARSGFHEINARGSAAVPAALASKRVLRSSALPDESTRATRPVLRVPQPGVGGDGFSRKCCDRYASLRLLLAVEAEAVSRQSHA